jgi:cell fate regulator YaaT (PSP1 superfamily)
MTQTVEVRFKGTRKAYFLWDNDADPLRVKDPVIVEVERGRDLGRVTAVGDMAEKRPDR